MELIKDLWHGDIPLSKAFWLFGVCVSVLFKAIFFYFTLQPQIFSTEIGLIFFWLLTIAGVIYSPFILISIWRSANKYKGIRIYASLAKFVVIFFGWGGYIRDLIEMGKLLLN
jgi:hypothetical protein